jgi:DNA-binding NtrC family response regulator
MRPEHDQLTQPPQENSQAALVAPSAQQFRERCGVLVVDDDHLVRILVQVGLERNGFDVWLACNGREALRLYRKHRDRIGVVLLEVRLPGLDGPRIQAALRALNPQVPVCFMSGTTDAHELEELRQRGAASVIAKPFYVDQLVSLLRPLVPGVPAEPFPSGGGCLG